MPSSKYLRQRNPNEDKEFTSLFTDPAFSRQAFQSVGAYLLSKPAAKPVTRYDKDGNETNESINESYTYGSLKRDLHNLAESEGEEEREPTELEMLLSCQIHLARTSTTAATFVRDTVGAAPVKQTQADIRTSSPLEELTDEELDALIAMRDKEELEDGTDTGCDTAEAGPTREATSDG